MSETRKKIIVVLGMHRSGTSVLARGMQILGASLGNRLMQAAADNEKGFFEDIDINAFNIELLSAIKLDWYYLSKLRKSQVEEFRREGYLLRGVELIQNKIKDNVLFCFKDPRTCKLLPVWKKIFSLCQVDVSYVLATRNPLSVVKSLQKRNGFTAEHGYLLWLGYVIESLDETAGSSRVLVNYDFLMQSPDTELGRIAKSLNLTVDRDKLLEYKADFIDEKLRHSIYSVNDLQLDSACPTIVSDVYSKLLSVASGETSLDQESLSKDVSYWLGILDNFKDYFSAADKIIAQNVNLKQEFTKVDGLLELFNKVTVDHQPQITQIMAGSTGLDGLEVGMIQTNSSLEMLTGHILNLINTVNELNCEIVRLNQTLNELNQKAWEVSEWGKGLQTTLEERDQQINELSQKAREASEWRTELQAQLTDFNGQVEVTIQNLSDLFEWFNVYLTNRNKQLVETQQALDAKHAELMNMSDWAYGMMLELQRRNAPLHRRLVEKAITAKRILRKKLALTPVGAIVRHIRDRKSYRANMVSFEAIVSSLNENNGRLIIAFPIINWDFRWQRPQHIVSHLRNHGYSVLNIAMSMTPLNRRFRTIREAGAALKFNNLADNVNQIWLHSKEPINIYTDRLTGDNLHNLVSGLSALLDTLKPKSVRYLIQFPGWWPVAEALRNRYGGKVIFDCMDDHAGFSTHNPEVLKVEENLIKHSDLVVTSSALLENRCRALNSTTIQVKNGTEFEHFHAPQPNGELDHLKGNPIIGYYGAISDWFDTTLTAYCAQMRPHWQFVLIGSTFGADLSPVERLPNVHFLGEKPYSALPGYLAYFDVCTIPFKLIPLTLATNPVKFYEYLSAGKPVVSVNLPELVPYQEDCYLAQNAAEFLGQIDRALEERDDIQKIARRLDLARANSWDSRVNAILAHTVFN